MEDIKIGNIPLLDPSKCIKLLSLMYSNVINSNKSLDTLPSVMLWGPPGIGKSQAIKQVAKEIEKKTNKKVNVTDVRLILFNPVDLRGIPTSSEDKKLAVWLKPKIFQMDESDDVINILFLDEISAAPQSVQAAAYQITLDKKIGEHKLPNNCIVIAAGNRVTDKSVSYQMPKALANRLLHIEIESKYDSWKNWAIKNDIHPYVLGFLDFKQDYLNKFDSKTNELAFATPRTWEMVSNILKNVSDDIKEIYPLIAGLVGKGVAVEFKTFTRIYKDLPNVEHIFYGTEVFVPRYPDVLYALISSMISYAKEHKDNMELIENSINYALMLPPDFSIVLLKDYMYLEKDYLKKLMKIPAYTNWLMDKGRLIDVSNGI